MDPSSPEPDACIVLPPSLWDSAASLISQLGTTAKGVSVVRGWGKQPAHLPGFL